MVHVHGGGTGTGPGPGPAHDAAGRQLVVGVDLDGLRGGPPRIDRLRVAEVDDILLLRLLRGRHGPFGERHEVASGNTDLFAAATKLSSDNGKMDPVFHAMLTRMAGNKEVYRPGWKKVLERYAQKIDNEADDDGSEWSAVSM